MTKLKHMKKLLKAAYLAGFKTSGEGYNDEYPFMQYGRDPEKDHDWSEIRDHKIEELIKGNKK
jgi:hypothetical protein